MLEFVVAVHQCVVVATHSLEVFAQVLRKQLLFSDLAFKTDDGSLLVVGLSSFLLVSLKESTLVLQEEPVLLLNHLNLIVQSEAIVLLVVFLS